MVVHVLRIILGKNLGTLETKFGGTDDELAQDCLMIFVIDKFEQNLHLCLLNLSDVIGSDHKTRVEWRKKMLGNDDASLSGPICS